MKEAISKFNIIGSEYVKLEDLNELITDMQKKVREGREPGYMNHTKEQGVAVDVMLNHLKVILNKERNFDGILSKIMRTRFAREDREREEKQREREDAPTPEALETAEEALKMAAKAVSRATELIGKIMELIDDDEPEYHGDGTRAEDEDWEDE